MRLRGVRLHAGAAALNFAVAAQNTCGFRLVGIDRGINFDSIMGFLDNIKMMPAVTKNLIAINVVVWLAMALVPSLAGTIERYCALYYFTSDQFVPSQLITYMFVHGGFVHLFFNMFALYMFGVTMERVLGGPRFLFYYITCGLCAGLVQEAFWALTWEPEFVKTIANLNGVDFEYVRQALASGEIGSLVGQYQNMMVTIGASGSIYGVLLAFGMLFPNRPLYIMFIPVPVKAKWVVIGNGVIELLIGMGSARGAVDGIAHWAHLGGMIFGLLIMIYWKRKGIVHGDNY